MEPNNTTQTPTSEPVPPTTQPPQMSPVAGPPKKSKLPLLIALVVAVLAVGGTVAYFLMKNTTKTPGTANTQTTDDSVTTTTSSLTNDDKDYGSGTISVTHPKDWKVETGKDQDGANQLVITSEAGNVLRLTQQIGGLGATCEPDTDSYTLVKKIRTKDPLHSFTEYTTTAPNFSARKLAIESFANASAAHKALTEGQTGTDVCGNIGLIYPIVDGMFVKIQTTDGDEATYDTIKSDTQFVDMLESFTTDNPDAEHNL